MLYIKGHTHKSKRCADAAEEDKTGVSYILVDKQGQRCDPFERWVIAKLPDEVRPAWGMEGVLHEEHCSSHWRISVSWNVNYIQMNLTIDTTASSTNKNSGWLVSLQILKLTQNVHGCCQPCTQVSERALVVHIASAVKLKYFLAAEFHSCCRLSVSSVYSRHQASFLSVWTEWQITILATAWHRRECQGCI